MERRIKLLAEIAWRTITGDLGLKYNDGESGLGFHDGEIRL